MVNEDIRGGLKSAIERGQSLKNAMLSLLHAGYDRNEIEEAARTLTETIAPENKIISTPAPPKNYIEPSVKNSINQIFKKLVPEEKMQNSKPNVSDYQEKTPKNKSVIIVLICALVFLFGILLLLAVFRQDLINLFHNLFS